MVACYGLTQFEFNEEMDLKSYAVWMCDVVHAWPPFKPLYAWAWCYNAARGLQGGAEWLHLPATKGWDYRLINGCCYLTVMVTTEDEAKQREPRFRERIAPWIDDFDGEYGKVIDGLMEDYKRIQGVDISQLSNIDLLLHFDDFLLVYRDYWWWHMFTAYVVSYVFGLFESLAGELCGLTRSDPQFQKLMGGFDSMIYRVNKGLWELGHRAVELGLGDIFLAGEPEEAVTGLEQSEAGRKWLEEYRPFLQKHGWRCQRMLDWTTPNWIEKPSLGIASIRPAVAKGGSFVLDVERGRLAEERVEAETEVLSRVPEEQKEWFGKLMRVAQKAGAWSEDHTYYMDMYCEALGRWMSMEYGKRFARAGVIDEPEDIYFLLPDQIRKAAIPMGWVDLRPYVDRHREEWESYAKGEPAFFYGDPTAIPALVARDPLISVSAVLAPTVKPELKADLYGAASAPGVVEGVARVVITEDRLIELQPGEILVAPGTSAAWTPAFAIAAGVVTDGGGMLSHAVIVSREYGIPCVAGTLEATKNIKTGQKIRVDGDMGAVYFLA